MKRFAHPGRAVAFALIVILIAAGAFIAGLAVRSPDASILDARDENIPVLATVEMRSVTDAIRIQGETIGSERESIYVVPPDGAVSAVVTSTPIAPGSELHSGQLLASVSDRPIFVLFVEVPLFRDLRMNDEGSDVRALQEALGLRADGEVGTETMRAVRRLYVEAGFTQPGGDDPFIKMSEFESMRPAPTTLEAVANVGQVLRPDVPLATVTTGASFVQVRATVREADQIAAGSPVTIQTTDAQTLTGRVTSVSEFREADIAAGKPPGRDIHVEFVDGDPPGPGEPVTALFGEATEPQLAVPTIAVRNDADGSYVLKQSGEGAVRVLVEQLRSAGGWTAIQSTALVTGDRVLVSG